MKRNARNVLRALHLAAQPLRVDEIAPRVGRCWGDVALEIAHLVASEHVQRVPHGSGTPRWALTTKGRRIAGKASSAIAESNGD